MSVSALGAKCQLSNAHNGDCGSTAASNLDADFTRIHSALIRKYSRPNSDGCIIAAAYQLLFAANGGPVSKPAPQEVSLLLQAWCRGDESALEKLMPLASISTVPEMANEPSQTARRCCLGPL
jgi:hypothetical protein